MQEQQQKHLPETDIKPKVCKNTDLNITSKKPNLTGRELCTPISSQIHTEHLKNWTTY